MAHHTKLTHAHLPAIADALEAMGQNPNATLTIADLVATHHASIRIAHEVHKYSFEEIAETPSKAIGVAGLKLSARSLRDAYGKLPSDLAVTTGAPADTAKATPALTPKRPPKAKAAGAAQAPTDTADAAQPAGV